MGLFDAVGDVLGLNPEPARRDFRAELSESVEGLAGVRPDILKYDERDRPKFNEFERRQLFANILGDENGAGILDLLTQTSGAGRRAEMDQVGQLAPGAQDVLRQLAPESQSILDTLIAQTQESLGRGGAGALDQQRVREATRSAQAARGMGYSPMDSVQEAVNLLANDEQAQMRRRAEAQGMLGTIADQRTNPILDLLMGRTQYNSGPLLNLSAGINQSSTLPLNPYAYSDVGTYNANATNAARIGAANNAGALAGTVLGGVFDMAGANMERKANAPGSGSQSLFSFLGF